jgi:hypothetical protein
MDMKTDEPNVRLWIDNCRKDIKPVWRGNKAKEKKQIRKEHGMSSTKLSNGCPRKGFRQRPQKQQKQIQ